MKRIKELKQNQVGKMNAHKLAEATKPERWKFYSVLAVILLISLIVYLPVLQNGFVWDDKFYIENNPLIYSFDLQEFFSTYVLGNYHPVTILTFAAEYHFFGLNETGYHAVNLLLHLLNVILVCFAVFLLSDKAGVALIAALLFGIHPMHLESVAWAAELKDLLYTFFFLVSYIFYLSYLRSRHKSFYYFALLFFSIALLSKAMAASLAVVLILTDYFKGRKIDAKSLLEKAPFFVLAIVFGIVAILAQKSSGAIQDMSAFSFPQRLIFASYGFITYIWKLFLPFNLSAFYPYPIKPGANIPIQFYSYLILLIGLVASVLYSVRYTKKIFFGLGFFAVTIFLVLQLLPVGDAIMADRYSYISSIGIFYLAGEGFYLLWSNKLKFLAIILLSAFTVFFSSGTYIRCGVWKNDMTLWSDVISQYQTVPYAYSNRGDIFAREKSYDRALNDFTKAIELSPMYLEAYYNRGAVFMTLKKYDSALDDFNKAIELNPKYSAAYYNRGIVFLNGKKYDQALYDFSKAIALRPLYIDAYLNRSIVYIHEKKYEEALLDCNKVIELNSKYSLAYINRGCVFLNTKRYDEAISNFSKVIVEYTANKADAFYFRGWAEYYSGKNDAACLDMKQASSLGYKPADEALQQICN